MTKRVKLFRMIDIAPELVRLPDFWKDIEYTEDGETVKVFTARALVNHLSFDYPTFRFFDTAAYMLESYTVTTAAYNLGLRWNIFVQDHPELPYIAQMLNRRDYDPLENYDRHEDGGWKDTTDDDAIHRMQYAQVETTTVNDPKLKTKTTGKVYPDDGSAAMPDTESITEPVRDQATDVDTVTTTTPTHTDQSSVEGDTTVTRLYQGYHVHGNIGVTTAAQMIAGEAETREKFNLQTRIMKMFANEVLTLVKEVIVDAD